MIPRMRVDPIGIDQQLTRLGLIHQVFIRPIDRPSIAQRTGRRGGSIEPLSVECEPCGKNSC